MPRASQVDETRHRDTQKAALIKKDSRMVGPGAGAEMAGEGEPAGQSWSRAHKSCCAQDGD